MMTSVADCLGDDSLEAVVALRAPPEAQARVEWLAGRANEGELTDDEQQEYQSCIMFANFVGILQSKAKKKLKR